VGQTAQRSQANGTTNGSVQDIISYAFRDVQQERRLASTIPRLLTHLAHRSKERKECTEHSDVDWLELLKKHLPSLLICSCKVDGENLGRKKCGTLISSMMHGAGPGVVRRDGQGKGTRALLACQAQNRTTIPSKSGDGSHTLRLTGAATAMQSVKTILRLERRLLTGYVNILK